MNSPPPIIWWPNLVSQNCHRAISIDSSLSPCWQPYLVYYFNFVSVCFDKHRRQTQFIDIFRSQSNVIIKKLRLLFTWVYVGDISLKLQLDFDTAQRFHIDDEYRYRLLGRGIFFLNHSMSNWIFCWLNIYIIIPFECQINDRDTGVALISCYF